MSKSLYLECGSGISGDMTVAALLDLGADREVLEKSLESLKLPGYEIAITRVKKSGLDACDFNVILDAEHENHDHDMAYLHGDGAEVHDHPHDHEHHHDHDHCCCGHDHEHVENSMDTDWDVSGVHPSQYRLLFSTLGAIAGVKDVGLNPDGLRIIHTPEALPAIKQAFEANNLKLKMRTNEGKETTQIRIQQMDCPTEEGLIRKKLNGMKGVSGLQFNLMNRVLTVSYPKGCFLRLLLRSNLSITPLKFWKQTRDRSSPNSNRPRLPGGSTFSALLSHLARKPASTSAFLIGSPLSLLLPPSLWSDSVLTKKASLLSAT